MNVAEAATEGKRAMDEEERKKVLKLARMKKFLAIKEAQAKANGKCVGCFGSGWSDPMNYTPSAPERKCNTCKGTGVESAEVERVLAKNAEMLRGAKPVYTTWDRHASNITLSNGGMTAQSDIGDFGARTILGGTVMTGKQYVEVELHGSTEPRDGSDPHGMGSLFVGAARTSLVIPAPRGDRGNHKSMDAWFMLVSDGSLCGNGKEYSDRGRGYKDGDRLGILVDLNDGCLLFFKNGQKNGPGFTSGVTGSIVLAMFFGDGTAGAGRSATILAGAKTPSGY
jgi:hypothetical protein